MTTCRDSFLPDALHGLSRDFHACFSNRDWALTALHNLRHSHPQGAFILDRTPAGQFTVSGRRW